MKDYIVIENENNNQFDSVEELIDYIFGNEYKNLNNKEKLYKRYEKAFYLKIVLNNKDIEIVESDIGVLLDKYTYTKKEYDKNYAIIIDDEISLIKSLCKYNQIVLLEKKGKYKFHKKEDEIYLKEGDNYIIVNKLENYS